MKRYVLFFCAFIILIFLLPVVFTKQYESDSSVKKSEESENTIIEEAKKDETKDFNYNEFSTIRLLHSNSGEIEELGIDIYLLGVLSAEMPASFEQEALNAQAVVARTYTIYTIRNSIGKHDGADICDNPNCCQAWISKETRQDKWEENLRDDYWKKIELAINTTKGKVIKYEGEVIDAFFHSNSGGITEEPINVWGGTNFPYLQAVQTSGEEVYSQYNSEVILDKNDFIEKIKQKHPNFEIDFSKENCIEIKEYTNSNRVKTIKIGNLELSGVEVRSILGLKSANFQVEINDKEIRFIVKGYGHGVGLSQTGADSMAKQGAKYEEIIKHFYKGVEIDNL